jgi:hypothetical protein
MTAIDTKNRGYLPFNFAEYLQHPLYYQPVKVDKSPKTRYPTPPYPQGVLPVSSLFRILELREREENLFSPPSCIPEKRLESVVHVLLDMTVK